MKYLGINYSNRINKQGVTIHNLNGMTFCSVEASGESYMLNDLKNDLGDYSKEKLFTNLKKNKNYTTLLKKADAKSFESIEESRDFHFKIMQAIADQLGYEEDFIFENFLDNPKNEKKINLIMTVLHALTGASVSFPYRIDEKGIVSIVRYDSENKASVLHLNGNNDDEVPLSFLLKVDSSLGKNKK